MRIHECVIPSCRICRLLFVCINKSRIARQTPFPFVDDAKVRHKKAPDKEKNARGIVWGKWEWFRESFSR